MGIKNFGTITKRTPNALSKITYDDLRGQTVAIDASIFCYRFSHNPQSKRPNSHIDGFYQLFLRLLKFKIRPILIFDGKTPSEKHVTLEKRAKDKQKNLDKIEKLQQELMGMAGAKTPIPLTLQDQDHILKQFVGSPQETAIKNKIDEINKANKNVIQFQPSLYDDIRLLCDLMNIPILRANGEADALCAKLYETGQVQSIMSEDSDILLYKGGRLVRKFGWKNEVELVDLDKMLGSLGITHDQFIDLAILCGTDYTASTIGGLGPINALECITQGRSIEQILEMVQKSDKYNVPSPDSFTYQQARNLIKNARQFETSVQVAPFDLTQFKCDALEKLLVEKCRYRPVTIQKHCAIIREIYERPVVSQTIIPQEKKIKIALKIKAH